MPEVKPLKLMDVGGGAGEMREFGVSDTLPADNLPANVAALAGLAGTADKLPYFTSAGALALSDYAPAARYFNAAATVAEQRTALGLGTAAVAALTSSAADTTTGRVTRVGDGGLLGDCPSADPSTAGRVTGMYTSGVSSDLVPTAAHVFLNLKYSGLDRKFQIGAAVSTTEGYYVRSQLSNGVFTPTRELWHSGGTNAITVDTGSIGYGAGSGGTVTQATSKSTAVTLNKPSGRITMHAESLAAGASVIFSLNSTAIATADQVIFGGAGSTPNNYRIEHCGAVAGMAQVRVTNITGAPRADALVIGFTVIKGATA